MSPGDFQQTKKRVLKVLNIINPKRLLVLGGEHTITTITIEWLSKKHDIYYVHVDAHSDFEEKYLGNKWSHACVLRRIFEILGGERICLLGLRSTSKNALEDLENQGIRYYTSFEIIEDEKIILNEFKKANAISIDVDVFDISFAPDVSCPEPFGLSPFMIVNALLKSKPIYIDIVEVTAKIPTNITAILAATVARESIITLDW